MKTTPLLVTALAAVAAAVPIATASASDPAGAVKADLTQLQADITKAHDTLLADLAKISADTAKGDRAAIKADLQAFRSDRQSLVGACHADIAQLKTDLAAAKQAKAGSADLRALLKSVHDLAKQDRGDVQSAAKSARAAIQSLRGSHPKGTTGAHGATPSAPKS